MNTGGFTFDYATPTDDNQGIFRLDHTFNSNWRLDGSVNISDRKQLSSSQVDIVNRLATARFRRRAGRCRSAWSACCAPT